MRGWIVAAALALAACSAETGEGGLAGAPQQGYTLEVLADEGRQIYRVTAPDGRVAAAEAADGRSALLDARALGALELPEHAAEPPPEVLAIRAPGFSLSVKGEGGEKGGESGEVALTFGDTSIEVQGRDGAAGGADAARVRIAGVDEATAREFITDADELSPSVQAGMLAALGME